MSTVQTISTVDPTPLGHNEVSISAELSFDDVLPSNNFAQPSGLSEYLAVDGLLASEDINITSFQTQRTFRLRLSKN